MNTMRELNSDETEVVAGGGLLEDVGNVLGITLAQANEWRQKALFKIEQLVPEDKAFVEEVIGTVNKLIPGL